MTRGVVMLSRAARPTAVAAAAVIVACLTAGSAWAPPRPGAVVDLSHEFGVRVDGAAAGDDAGVTVAPVGDVNGDGLGDFAVGAGEADNRGRPNSGSAYVIFSERLPGRVDLASFATGFRIDGADVGGELGASVAGAGDVNGDGRADVVVGADDASVPGRPSSGFAYVVFGKTSTDAVDTAALGASGFAILGAAAGHDAGEAVSPAGDVNGDGRADLVIGAPDAGNNGRPGSGAAYVVFGRSGTDTVDLAALGGGGFAIDGAAAGDQAGFSVAGAGDVNGDGRADVVVGAEGADNNGRAESGSAYVVFGKAAADTVDLAALGGGGFRIDGAGAGDETGPVAGAGDVNRDGRADVIVGAKFADNNGRNDSGSAYVVFGKTSSDPIDLSRLGAGGTRIDGAAAEDHLGGGADERQAVAPAGDVNGDGRPDVFVGASDADPNRRGDAGSAYVVFGNPAVRTVDLARLGRAGLRIDGAFAGDRLGEAVAAGDINGDRRADLLVGADDASPQGRTRAGSAYVVFGVTPTCEVPRVVRLTLRRARTALAAARCRAGKVRSAYSSRVPKGLVVSQRPAAGAERASGARVAIVVSRGKRPRRAP